MQPQVIELDDATIALERAESFLASNPVQHNLLRTILDQSIEFSLGGTFWLVTAGSDVIGFAIASPAGMPAVLAPMALNAAVALAEAVTVPLPGVVGEAGTAAVFAGRWTECHSTSVTEIDGQRLYELTELKSVANANGILRRAGADDRSTLIEWVRAFTEEAGTLPSDAEAVVDLRLARGQFWVWDDNGAVSMASTGEPAAGVSRVQHVYTPPASRGSGYATACVQEMSRVMIDRGLRCALYTDLANATSNSIYRNIGYRAVAEILGYDFA